MTIRFHQKVVMLAVKVPIYDLTDVPANDLKTSEMMLNV